MTALETFALFFGLFLVFTLGMVTGAALAGLGHHRRQQREQPRQNAEQTYNELIEQVVEDRIRSTRH